MCKIRKDLSISDKDKEILTIEIISKESKNMLRSCCYRPPKDITENVTAYLASVFQGVQTEKKKSFIIGDFKLNCLNFSEDSNIRQSLSLDLFLLSTSLQGFVTITQQ